METSTDIFFACPGCGQSLSAPPEMVGMAVSCPHCHQEMTIPAPTPADAAPAAVGALCAICQTGFGAQDAKVACPGCHAEYHEDCWTENGGCAVYGCSHVPATEKLSAVEIPVSYWGQENKECPVCKTKILAAAVRCRSCGTTFESARPEDAAEFRKRAIHLQMQPGLQKKVVIVFVLCLIPCTAPIASIGGGIWFYTKRHEIDRLPALYGALSTIGLLIAILQTVLLILAFLVASVRS